MQARLEAWLKMHVANVLAPLVSLRDAADVEGLARGIAFRLVENLGSLTRESVAEDVRALDQAARGQLRKHGVRFGAYSIFMPALLKPAPARLRLTLWALANAAGEGEAFENLPAPPTPGLTSVPADPTAPEGFYETVGFRVCGTRAVRIDMLERVADLIRPVIAARAYNGGFIVTPDMMSLVGCSGEEFASLLRGLGYRSQVEAVTPPAKEAPKENEAAPAAEQGAEADATSALSAVETPEEPAPAGEPEEMPAADVPAPVEAADEGEATPEEQASAPASPETSSEAVSVGATLAAETAAPVEMEIWRPVRKRHGGKPENERKKPRRDKKKHDGEQEAHGNKPQRRDRRPTPPAKPDRKPREREPDPDSPFAALAVLKERVRGNGS